MAVHKQCQSESACCTLRDLLEMFIAKFQGIVGHLSKQNYHSYSVILQAVLRLQEQTYMKLCDVHRYIPSARMQYEYPGTYQASDAQSCSADSNLLIHDEADLYNDPYADPYEDNPDSPHGRCPAEEAEAQSQQAVGTASDTESGDGDSSEATGGKALKAEASKESREGPGDGLPEQSVGTDVKR